MQDITTQEFKTAGDLIYVIGETTADFNGSELQKMLLGKIEGRLMAFDLAKEKNNQQLVLKAIRKQLVKSAHDCSEGGLAIALAEAAFKNAFGFDITVNLPVSYLFSESQSRFILSISPENKFMFEKIMNGQATYIGKVTDDGVMRIQTKDQPFDVVTTMAKELWEEAIPCLMK